MRAFTSLIAISSHPNSGSIGEVFYRDGEFLSSISFSNTLPLGYGLYLHYLGLTLRLKGKEFIPENGEVVITDLPVGGSRRYDSLECLSNVPDRGRMEEAYWEYADPDNFALDHRVDNIHCKGDECKSPDIGWWSSKGTYRKGKRYYGVVILGRRFENATVGLFTCHYEGDSSSPVSVSIIASEFYHHSRLIW